VPEAARETRATPGTPGVGNIAEIGKASGARMQAGIPPEPAQSAAAAARAAAGLMRDAGAETHRAVEQARDTTMAVMGNIQRGTTDVASVAGQAAEAGRETLLAGVRTATDASYEGNTRALDTAARVLDIYRDAAERSAAQLEAMTAAGLAFGTGMQRIQHAWLEAVNRTLSQAGRRRQDLFRCANMADVAALQRDLYLGAVATGFETSTTLLDLAGRAARDAMLPLQAQRDVSEAA